jgi:hypothetical protein
MPWVTRVEIPNRKHEESGVLREHTSQRCQGAKCVEDQRNPGRYLCTALTDIKCEGSGRLCRLVLSEVSRRRRNGDTHETKTTTSYLAAGHESELGDHAVLCFRK